MRLHKSILIGTAFACVIGLAAAPHGSFACYTGIQYRTDCCNAGYVSMGNFCCKSVEDCANETFENCRLNFWFRFGNPCEGAPPICFAEAILNDEIKIDILRRFRDEVLSQTPVGQEYIKLYYEWSPAIIQAIEEDDGFKEEVRELIDELLPMIEKAME